MLIVNPYFELGRKSLLFEGIIKIVYGSRKVDATMSNICMICEKRPRVVNNVSNANNKTKRWVYPNVHVIRFTLKGQRSIKRGAVCTKCLKAGKVEKVV